MKIIFEEVFFFIASLILLLFLTGLGRKVFKRFGLQVEVYGELLFSLGLGIIAWGTLILILGMLEILYFCVVWGFFGVLFIVCGKEMIEIVREVWRIRWIRWIRGISDRPVEKKLFLIFVFLIFLNIIGALTPEKGVDAIGYHLYFPKVYLENQTMMLPARGSRLFSLFPHLASMIYLLPVSLNMPNIAQLTHMWLGVLTAVVIGLVTKSMTASLIFYSAIVVGSISRSAYSDFFITFFLSLGILGWVRLKGSGEKEVTRWKIIISLMLGGALATKNQSLALIPIFVILSLLFSKGDLVNRLLRMLKTLLIAFCVPSLWYLRSIIISGNPFYPMFILKDVRVPQFNFNYYLNFEFIKYFKIFFTFQPIFIIFIFFFLFTKDKTIRKQIFIGILVFIYWVLLPESFHDNRYFLPYFVLIIFIWSPLITKLLQLHSKSLKLGLFVIIGILAAIRFYTNVQYLPYIFGFEEKKVFLSNALRERPEDFYDIDGQFSVVIKNKRVLTDNVLGLYYVNFPYDEFDYSIFYGKKMAINEFKDDWKKGDYSFLLLKNEKLTVFFAKMGISSGESLFKLSLAHAPSKTYLLEPNFR